MLLRATDDDGYNWVPARIWIQRPFLSHLIFLLSRIVYAIIFRALNTRLLLAYMALDACHCYIATRHIASLTIYSDQSLP